MTEQTDRFELSETERAVAEAVGGEWSHATMAKTLLRAPRLLPSVGRLALRAAVRGVWNDVELAVLLDSERVRQALSGTARGAAWSPDETFLDALSPRLEPTWSALEIGCGVGRISRQVAPHVRELVCSDVSGVMIEEATANLAQFANVRLVRTSGYWLEGLPDASFDVVFAHAVFFFFDLYPAIAMLDATRRVLRDGGTFVVDFLTIDRPDWAFETVELARHYAARGAFGARAARPYTEAQIRALCAAVGLAVTECSYGGDPSAERRLPLIVMGTASTRPGEEGSAAESMAGSHAASAAGSLSMVPCTPR